MNIFSSLSKPVMAGMLILSLGATATSCSDTTTTATPATSYAVTPLIADTIGYGTTVVDPTLKNPWGVTNAPLAPLFVANNHSSSIGEYDLTTGAFKKSFTIPSGTGSPTGLIYNSDLNSFAITGNGQSNYLFATEDGTIGGLSVNNDISVGFRAPSGTASYKGLAVGSNAGSARLYAANFKNSSIDVFNPLFARIAQSTDVATGSDALPAGYAPFNIANLNGTLYVSFALAGSNGDDVPGSGNGYIDVFNVDGTYQKRLASRGTLNSPWGMAIAPDDFGDNKGKLLVGNFGDGRINIFDPSNGNYIGQLKDAGGNVITIPGLWALYVSNGVLYYTAGPGNEEHGVIGTISVK